MDADKKIEDNDTTPSWAAEIMKPTAHNHRAG